MTCPERLAGGPDSFAQSATSVSAAPSDQISTQSILTQPASTPPQNMTSGPAGADASWKEFTTLQARAALRGFRLDRIEADAGGEAFIVTRWALTRELRTLEEVTAFLDQVGGSHAG